MRSETWGSVNRPARRTSYLVKWINATVYNRRWSIRASVLALAFGVSFMAAPFVGTSQPGEIPAAATAPEIPAQIAPDVAPAAVALFTERVESFNAASKERDDAIAAASDSSQRAARHDDHLNWVTFWIATGALCAALLGPAVPGRIRALRRSGCTTPPQPLVETTR